MHALNSNRPWERGLQYVSKEQVRNTAISGRMELNWEVDWLGLRLGDWIGDWIGDWDWLMLGREGWDCRLPSPFYPSSWNGMFKPRTLRRRRREKQDDGPLNWIELFPPFAIAFRRTCKRPNTVEISKAVGKARIPSPQDAMRWEGSDLIWCASRGSTEWMEWLILFFFFFLSWLSHGLQMQCSTMEVALPDNRDV
jgi:hypothetical protein